MVEKIKYNTGHKNFDYYIDLYLCDEDDAGYNDLVIYLDEMCKIDIKGFLKKRKFEYVPFEIKLGLLMLICKDKNLPFLKVIKPIETIVGSEYWHRLSNVISLTPNAILEEVQSQFNN